MEVIQSRANLGAEIRGVDLKEMLDVEAHQTIHDGLMDHGILIFRARISHRYNILHLENNSAS